MWIWEHYLQDLSQTLSVSIWKLSEEVLKVLSENRKANLLLFRSCIVFFNLSQPIKNGIFSWILLSLSLGWRLLNGRTRGDGGRLNLRLGLGLRKHLLGRRNRKLLNSGLACWASWASFLIWLLQSGCNFRTRTSRTFTIFLKAVIKFHEYGYLFDQHYLWSEWGTYNSS